LILNPAQQLVKVSRRNSMKTFRSQTAFHIAILISLLAVFLMASASLPSPNNADTLLRVYSEAAKDGWILESTETSGVGGTKSSTSAQLSLGDNAQNKQFRAILHFNTAGLPDNAVITGAWVFVKRAGSSGIDPFTAGHGILVVDTATPKGIFGAFAALQLEDFKAMGSNSGKFDEWWQVDGLWYRATLNSWGLGDINRVGPTQYRLRFSVDDDNDHIADILKIYSGECSLSMRPQLAVQYHLP
jgi:hypothetical protein